MAEERITKVTAEVLVDPTPVARVTKVSVEVLVAPQNTVACRWSLMGVGQR